MSDLEPAERAEMETLINNAAENAAPRDPFESLRDLLGDGIDDLPR